MAKDTAQELAQAKKVNDAIDAQIKKDALAKKLDKSIRIILLGSGILSYVFLI